MRFLTGWASRRGVTLIEMLLAAMTLAIAISALLGAFLGQLTLKEHANNLSLAIHDANRIIEQIRQDNLNCQTPSIDPSDPADPGDTPTSWDSWLEAQSPGKSIPNTNANAGQLIVVTCRSRDGSASCGTGGTRAQVGSGEWSVSTGATTFNPIQITVSVCWRHRNRTIGECSWSGSALSPADTPSPPNVVTGVIESPASLTTLVTCRG